MARAKANEEERTDGAEREAPYSVLSLPYSVLCRPGDDLLSRVLRQSTIGAEAFDGRVRDGIGSYRLARATRPAKDGVLKQNWRFAEARNQKSEVRSALSRALHFWLLISGFQLLRACARRSLIMRTIKSNERLVPVSCTRCRASTSGLSTWWSSTALQGEIVLRLVSRLDAFSGYPFRI